MGVVHFLNVGPGDCSIIQHASGRVTIIDVCKARVPKPSSDVLGALTLALELESSRQLPMVDNPISYMQDRNIDHIFRFILSHPDMDHMDGLKDVFSEFSPLNFWDTENTCTKSFSNTSPYRKEDWYFYQHLRDGKMANPKRLTLYSGARSQFYNLKGEYGEPQDGLYILSPTQALVAEANRTNEFNDASYVVLYRSLAGRILFPDYVQSSASYWRVAQTRISRGITALPAGWTIVSCSRRAFEVGRSSCLGPRLRIVRNQVLFCGDAHDKTWEHVLENHLTDIYRVELMIAPHHGRDSGRDRSFLSEVMPKLTLFGVAPSEHLAYDAWRSRGLDYITSNQAGTIIVDAKSVPMKVYVTKKSFARKRNPKTAYSFDYRAWLLRSIT